MHKWADNSKTVNFMEKYLVYEKKENQIIIQVLYRWKGYISYHLEDISIKVFFWLMQKCINVPITRKRCTLWQIVKGKEKKENEILYQASGTLSLSFSGLTQFVLLRDMEVNVEVHKWADNSKTVNFTEKHEVYEKKENKIII